MICHSLATFHFFSEWKWNRAAWFVTTSRKRAKFSSLVAFPKFPPICVACFMYKYKKAGNSLQMPTFPVSKFFIFSTTLVTQNYSRGQGSMTQSMALVFNFQAKSSLLSIRWSMMIFYLLVFGLKISDEVENSPQYFIATYKGVFTMPYFVLSLVFALKENTHPLHLWGTRSSAPDSWFEGRVQTLCGPRVVSLSMTPRCMNGY